MPAKVKAKAKAKKQREIADMAAEARLEVAMQTYKSQDKATRDAIDTVVRRLEPTTPNQRSNMLYLVTEIFKDLALVDVQVVGFEFPKGQCAECGVELKKRRAA